MSNAAAALVRAEAAGVRLRLKPNGGVRMEAAAPPPPGVVTDLRRWREGVVHLLALRDGPSPETALAAEVPADPCQHPVEWWQLSYGPERGAEFAAARCAEGACRCCAGRRWWCGDDAQAAARCMTCHPPPPGLAFREMPT